MLVVLVCESKGTGRLKSRRTASKWLTQIGSSVWMGALSEEGALKLRDEIRATAKRNTSVVCYRMHSAWRFEIAWTAGNVSDWSETGAWAFRKIQEKQCDIQKSEE